MLCVVVDVQCDYTKQSLGDMRTGEVFMAATMKTMKIADVVAIETTVAPGTTEFVAYPIMRKAFQARGLESLPLLAHSYEWVMPGKEYIASIRDFWRVCSGCNEEATTRVVKFLNEVLNTKDFPLTVMDRPIESEATKIVENSYRAIILAFLNEWSLFAERNGVDLTKVIGAIKVPPHAQQHPTSRGRGSRSLPAQGWRPGLLGLQHMPGFEDDIFRHHHRRHRDANDTWLLHVAGADEGRATKHGAIHRRGPRSALRRQLPGGRGTTRYSGSELVVRKLAEMGAELSVHDPFVEHW